MSFLFSKKPRGPADLVKQTKEALLKLEGTDNKAMAKGSGYRTQAVEEVAKDLQSIKNILYGEGDAEPVAETVAQLAQEVYNSDLLQVLIPRLGRVDFESRKDTALIFGNLLRRQIGARAPTVDYLCTHDQILGALVRSYDNPDVALSAGLMLRDCAKHEALTKIILNSEDFYRFFDYVELSTFDVASDAFSTFRELLTRHKALVAEFLEANYDKIIPKYTGLLQSENYVTKRQSLKLLGELLLDRTNFNVMTIYISNPDNLKLMMNLLRDSSRNVQFEAFHVFKVFVANPNKAKPIVDILIKNREKLVTFLSGFHNDRQDDEQFTEEKTFLLKQIQDL